MKPIQILIDEKLLAAVDRAAKRGRSDRSKLIRAAVADYLVVLRRRELEARERRGYQRHPDADEARSWQPVQAWPEH